MSVEEFVKKNKVALVDFYADWCYPCKVLEPVVDSLAEKVPLLRVDVDRDNVEAFKHEVMSIPTIILFKDGKEVKRWVGVKAGKEFELYQEILNLVEKQKSQ